MELYIHAGLHKTGTSFIQSFLNENRINLLRDQIFYPKLSKTNHSAFVGYARESLSQGHPKQSEWISKLRHHENYQAAAKLLLSSEEFSTDFRSIKRCQHYKDIFKGYDVKFIYYLRRQDHLIESVYAQVSKGYFCGWLADVIFPLDLNKTLDAVVQTFGPDSITVRPYNRKVWHKGNIAADLLHTNFGIDVSHYSNVSSTNISSNRRTTMFLASLDIPSLEKNQVFNAIQKAARIEDDGQKFCSSPQYRISLYNSLRESNTKVLQSLGEVDSDTFFGYVEDQNDEGWFAPEPLSNAEEKLIVDSLNTAGLDTVKIMASRKRDLF